MRIDSKRNLYTIILLCSALLLPVHALAMTISASEFISYQAQSNFLSPEITASRETSLQIGSHARELIGQNLTVVTRTFRNAMIFGTGSFLNEEVISATLEIDNPTGSYDSIDAFETFRLYDAQALRMIGGTTFSITGAGAVCNQNSSTLCNDIYDDLGSGTEYGSYEISAADSGTTMFLPLAQSAIDDLNNTTGTQFALGGALTSTPNLGTIVPNSTIPFQRFVNEQAFGNMVPFSRVDVRLVLEFADTPPGPPPGPTPVPEPSTGMLLGGGLLLLGYLRWRSTVSA